MQPLMRLLVSCAGALSLWSLFDGVTCLVTGHFVGKRIPLSALPKTPGGVLLPDGTALDYGLWASPLLDVGIEPERLAPYLVGLGLFGLVALALYLRKSALGWMGLLVFALLSSLRLGAGAVAGGVLLLALFAPSSRRRVFGVDASEVEQVQIRLERVPEQPDSDQADG